MSFRNVSQTTWLNLSSSARDKSRYPNSASCELFFQEIRNVKSLRLKAFEIPFTKDTISMESNTFYISEETTPGVYNFYTLKVASSSYVSSDLSNALTLSALCPDCLTSTTSMKNSYSFPVSSTYGKMSIISSGIVPYTIHICTDTYYITSLSILTSNEALLTYRSSVVNPIMPGALLYLHAFPNSTIEVQVISIDGSEPNISRLTIVGDFSNLSEIDVAKSTLLPFSSFSSMANILGFGSSDIVCGQDLNAIGLQSPFISGTSNITTSLLCTSTPHFLNTTNSILVSGTGTFLDSQILAVNKIKSETHVLLTIDRRFLFASETQTGSVSKITNDQDEPLLVTSITFNDIDSNIVDIIITVQDPHDLSISDEVKFLNYDSPELKNIRASVLEVVTSTIFKARFVWPTPLISSLDTNFVALNSSTGVPTTIVAPGRFDFSRNRRIMYMQMKSDQNDFGHIIAQNILNAKMFARIQLSFGGNAVNYLNSNSHINGLHECNTVIPILRSIKLNFFNEDGEAYVFPELDYTLMLELTTEGVNDI